MNYYISDMHLFCASQTNEGAAQEPGKWHNKAL